MAKSVSSRAKGIRRANLMTCLHNVDGRDASVVTADPRYGRPPDGPASMARLLFRYLVGMKNVLFVLLASAAFAAPPSYHVVNKIKIGGAGRWDYAYVD